MNMLQNENLGNVITRSWSDDSFKQRLINDPMTTLQEEKVQIPLGILVKVVENNDKEFHIVLPPKPNDSKLSDAQIEQMTASSFRNGIGSGRVAGDDWCECCGADLGIQ